MFWLHEWMDDRGVTSLAQAESRLSDPTEVHRLHERAASVRYSTEPVLDADGALLAGRGVDLSGDLDCMAWGCRRLQVDRLLRGAWHYFDRVVVVGPSASRVAQDLENTRDVSETHILSDIRLLLYLREIGAEPLLVFREKPPPCEVHVRQHAREVGLAVGLERLDELAVSLAKAARIESQPHDDHVHYAFNHSDFEHTVWGTVWPEGADLRVEVARAVLSRYMAHLTSDVRTARMLGLPLASTVHVHGQLLGLLPTAPSVADVMFSLSLPVLDGVDIKTLLELRDDQREYFERFRLALRTAASERLKVGQPTAPGVARAIEQDLIQPALIDIAVRLRAAADTLSAKKRITTTLSGLLTACGVYLSEPLLLSAGLVAGGASVAAAMKHVDDIGEVRLSDMFFLWEAQHQAHGKRV